MITVLGFSQDVLVAWTFDGLEGNPNGASNTPKVIMSNEDWGEGVFYADGTNGSDNFNNQSGPEINSFGGTVLNDPRENADASRDLALSNQSANGKSVVFKFSMSGYRDLQLTFAQRGSSTGFITEVWSCSTDGTEFVAVDSISNANASQSTSPYYYLRSIDFSSVTELNDADEVYIRLTVYGATNQSGNNRLDNIVFRANINGPDIYPPKITSHTVINASTLQLVFNENLNATTAEYKDNYESDDFTCTNAALAGKVVTLTVSPELAEGQTYQLFVANIEDLEGNVMAPDTLSITYGVDEQNHVATIAELRAKWTDALDINSNVAGNEVYKLTGNVIVTAINNSYRHQHFIQDETGAIVIDDNNNLIATALDQGDEIAGIYGKLSNYYGQLQFVITEPFTGDAITSFNHVEPLVVTVSNLLDVEFMNSHQSELIRIENAVFNANPNDTIKNNGKYTLTQNGVTGNAVWIHFWNVAGLTGMTIPTGEVTLTGVNKINYGEYFLIPRSGFDIASGIDEYLTEGDITIYPNPVADNLTISFDSDKFQVSRISVYDINGKFVKSQKIGDNNISMNVSELSAGTYFIRLSDGKHTFTTKFIKG